MEKSNQFDVRKIIQRLQQARLDLMQTMPFYAILLLQMQFSLDPSCETAYTDGKRIAFDPDFMMNLSEDELNFVLLHEVLHAALSHTNRFIQDYDVNLWNIACDIVVNSIILEANGDDLHSITLKRFGELMHLAPDGNEGREYSAEEVYRMLLSIKDEAAKGNEKKSGESGPDANESGGEGFDGEGTGDEETEAEDSEDEDSGDEGSGDEGTEGGGSGDEGTEGEGAEGNGSQGKKSGKGSSKGKGSGYGSERDGSEAEESEAEGSGSQGSDSEENKSGEEKSDYQVIGARNDGGFDDHTYWWLDKEEEDELQQREEETTWLQRMMDSTTIVEQMASSNEGGGCGSIPSCVERMLKELREPQTDWREMLDSFIQEEITDYSFNPPDRRFQDSPFLLPDYNEKEDSVKDILFMVDTSGSMSTEQITTCFSEIVGAIEQFNGHLKGWLGFFDAGIVEPVPFEEIEELKVIHPKGGGGTSFDIIFRYVEDYMSDQPPASIVILTDGCAPYPDEEVANGIPVLWIINNEEYTPTWGKVTRIKG